MNNNTNTRTKDLVTASMLIALSIIFSRFFNVPISEGLRLSFGQIPIIIAGVLLGPLWGFAVGIVSDITGYIINPMGAFMPGITLNAGLIGLIPGLMCKYILKNKTKLALVISIVINCLIVNGVFTTFWISLAYSSKNFLGWFLFRLPTELIMTVVYCGICLLLVHYLKKALFPNALTPSEELDKL